MRIRVGAVCRRIRILLTSSFRQGSALELAGYRLRLKGRVVLLRVHILLICLRILAIMPWSLEPERGRSKNLQPEQNPRMPGWYLFFRDLGKSISTWKRRDPLLGSHLLSHSCILAGLSRASGLRRDSLKYTRVTKPMIMQHKAYIETYDKTVGISALSTLGPQ